MRRRMSALAVAAVLLTVLVAPATAHGDPGPVHREAKLTEPPWDGEGHLGFAVDLGDGTAVATAPRDTRPGSAYVYVRDGTSWVRQANLTDPDGDGTGSFGFAAAVDGDTLAVGAPMEATDGSVRSGTVHVYVRSDGVWRRQASLTPDGATDGGRFGFGVDVDGDRLVATALEDAAGQGAAYVFTRSDDRWRRTATLRADVPRSALLGSSVALDDGTVVVGAPSADTERGADRGAAFVFERDGSDWSDATMLTAPDGAADDGYGESLDVDGDRVVVGAPQVDTEAAGDAGAAYIHRRRADGWALETRFTAEDAGRLDKLGFDVAIRGDTVVAGSPNHDAETPDAGPLCVEQNPNNVVVGTCGNNGAIYVLHDGADGWERHAKLVGTDKLGWSVDVETGTILGGAYLDDETGQDAGAAFVHGFDADGDGLTDDQEVAAGTDPGDADSDDDRLTDRQEVEVTRTSPLDPDTDRDGTPDGQEDPDADGLGHAAEVGRLGSDPFDPDTDGDLVGDGTEARGGSDPVNPTSVPTPAGPVTLTEKTHGHEVPVADHLPPAA